jgi:hypothetical protein
MPVTLTVYCAMLDVARECVITINSPSISCSDTGGGNADNETLEYFTLIIMVFAKLRMEMDR